MATYRILYWQEIQSQVRAEDDTTDVSVELPQKFMARIDAMAAERGLQGADDYLAQWHWSDEEDREGSAQEVADALLRDLNAQADW